MLSRRPFRKFHNYGLGLVSEILAPLLRMASRTIAPGPPSPPASWKRGLIIGHTRIGDVLFRTCSLEPLKKGLPDCEWHYLAAADSMEVLRHNPFLASVVSCCQSKHPLQLMPEAVWKLRAMKFDVALCTSPETYWQDHKVALMAGIPNRVGFIHRGLSGLVTHPVCCNYPASWAGYFQQIVSHLTGAA